MPQTIRHTLHELQTHTNPTSHPFGLEDDAYSSGDFSLVSSKESLFSHAKAETSNTIIMLVIVIRVANL